MARPADAVADRASADQAGRLERVELLEHARPARAEAGGQVLGGGGAVVAEPEQQVGAAEDRRSHGHRPCDRGVDPAAVVRGLGRRGGGAPGALRGSGIVREG